MKLRAALAFVVVGAFALSGCTGWTGPEQVREPAGPGGGEARLVAFDSCETALRELRSAAGASPVEPLPPAERGGVSGNEGNPEAETGDAKVVPARPQSSPGVAEGEARSPDSAPEEHSGTNNHEAGVEEPDLAYTDGSRIVTVAGGVLRVVDVDTRTVTSTVEVPGGAASNLLVDGDRALVVGDEAELTLVDLSTTARVLGTLRTEGGYVDARLVEGTARVVVSSAPAVAEPARAESTGGIDDWLPRYELARPDGTTTSGRLVDCDRVSHPETYRPTAILSVLTIDLSGELGTGDPVAIAAGGATVYGTADSLYIANPAGEDTEIFQFDITGDGPARHVASGRVEGTLLNQYAMSEYEDTLRVATTRSGEVDRTDGRDIAGSTDSAVSVLAREGDTLNQIGGLEGLGPGERIYAVRFFGPVGYVVTFRETDPLYTLDLRDPRSPKAVGELKITGYSAYLHNAGEGRLIGVGQEADERGRVLGVQVSLFDVSHAAAPRRLAQHQLSGGMALVEHDTHAFLYWEPERMLLLPTDTGVLVLRVSEANVTELGVLGEGESVSRTLVVGDEIWTVADSGLAVYDLAGLTPLATVPF